MAQYDSADYLTPEADIKNYLEAVFEEPMDREMLIYRLGVVARARGMMKPAKETGITQDGLYKALSPKGKPSFETVAKIVGAFWHATECPSSLMVYQPIPLWRPRPAR